MSALLLSALAAGSSGQGALYVDDVFSTYLYTGNGSTQNISGPNFADNAGLVWLKNRTSAGDHYLFDTVRGALNELNSNNTDASAPIAGSLTAFLNNGFSVGGSVAVNQSGQNYVGWQFRRAPKFFDVVTWIGNGSSVGGRTINHSLGATPGMVIIKATGEADNWYVWHRSVDTVGGLLNGTVAFSGRTDLLLLSSVSSASITTHPSNMYTNKNGIGYVAYLFAHDPSTEGIIQCGSFMTDASGNATINLGWESQYVLVKKINTVDNWQINDTSRGMSNTSVGILFPNTASAETFVSGDYLKPTATGFTTQNYSNSAPYIYLAIRRPNKPPTSGTEVYNAIARTGTNAAATVTGVGFAPDALIVSSRNSAGNPNAFLNRLVGASSWIESSRNTMLSEEYNDTAHKFLQDGVYWNNADAHINNNTISYINHFFRRAKGFFDIVCDTGTGVAHGITHGLSAAPEFIIRKSRSGSTQWECWHSALAATEKLVLNSTAAKATDATAWNSTLPTSTQFTVGTGANVNTNAATYVTYLFATLAGISKVGSYTGNGTSQTINCGFSTGSRFILVKRTDATGDWYVWDSVRGIIAANDPHLSLNTTAVEVTTDDSVDPDASGFIINQNTTTNINVNGGQYIFLAIA